MGVSNKQSTNYPKNIEELILALPSFSNMHAPGTEFVESMKIMARKEIEKSFSDSKEVSKKFEPFGQITLPYHKMGNIDSLDLFGLDELIIFSFYWVNRNRYKKVADIGANIGLHSIILDKCGFKVHSYEPDLQHFNILEKNLRLNNCSNVKVYNCAVSNKEGEVEFIRILGNTTGSHLAGSKPDSYLYGDMKRFSVKVNPINPIIAWADLLKIDAEGHEKEILLATSASDWKSTDALVEVGSENAKSIFSHFKKIGVNLFAQKINWEQIMDIGQMPTSYKDGSLFVTTKSKVPWQ